MQLERWAHCSEIKDCSERKKANGAVRKDKHLIIDIKIEIKLD